MTAALLIPGYPRTEQTAGRRYPDNDFAIDRSRAFNYVSPQKFGLDVEFFRSKYLLIFFFARTTERLCFPNS